MPHLSPPSTIDAAAATSRSLLQVVRAQIGAMPNPFRLVATSPGKLERYLGLFTALSNGTLPAPTRERIARPRTAGFNDGPLEDTERKFFWPPGRRPADHASLSDLGP